MFCPKCGAQISDGAAFCPKCGAAQTQRPAPVQPEPVQPTPAQPEPVQPMPAQQAPIPEQPAPQPQTYQYQQAPAPEQPAPQQQTYQYQYQQAPAPGQPAYQQQPPTNQSVPQGFSLKDFKMPTLGELFTGYNRTAVQYAESTGLQMKWYKAITVVLLYLGAFINLVAGLQYVTGNSYGSIAVYAFFPALRFVDFIFGLVYIVVALAVLYIRMRLAQFSSDAPRLYLTLLIANIIIGFVYSLLSSIITGSFDTFTLLASTGVGVAMYVLNRTYFEKRQHLFTM